MSAPRSEATATAPFREPLRSVPSDPPERRLRGLTTRLTLAVLRIALGWIFLWAVLDKVFGLGFATPPERAWVDGGSPTSGYLAGRDGVFADLFRSMAGQTWVDWLFMGAQSALAVALILGIGLRLAAVGGGLLLLSLWASMFQPENNPFMDEHLVYAIALAALAASGAGDTLGLGRAWARTALVRRIPALR